MINDPRDEPELIEKIVISYLHDTPVEQQRKNFAVRLVDSEATEFDDIEPESPCYFLVINVDKARIVASTFSKNHAIDIARIENKDPRAGKVKFRFYKGAIANQLN